MKTKIISLLIIGLVFLGQTVCAQQWFVKHWKHSPNGSQKPNFDPGGSTNTYDDNVLLYGTIGQNGNDLNDAPGKSDLILAKNSLSGSNIWTFTIGTENGEERISRVLEVRPNEYVITGQRDANLYSDGFIMKVSVTNSGSSYSMSIDAQPLVHPNSVFYDLERLNLYSSVNSNADLGIGVCGKNLATGKPIVFRCSPDLSFTGPAFWAKEYDSDVLNLNPLFRSLIAMNESGISSGSGGVSNGGPGNGDDPIDDGGGFNKINVIGLAGRIENHGLLVKMNMFNGNIIQEFTTKEVSSSQNESCESTFPNTTVFSQISFVKGFTELLQVDNGDIVATGNNYYDNQANHASPALFKIGFDLTTPKWFSTAAGTESNDGAHIDVFDLLKTDLGYTIVHEHRNQTNLMTYAFSYFSDDGQFLRSTMDGDEQGLSNATLSASVYSSGTLDEFPTWKDYALECAAFLHYPARESGINDNIPGWKNENFVHAKNGFNSEKACIEDEYSTTHITFCEYLTWNNKQDQINQQTNFTLTSDLWTFSKANHMANFTTGCVSECAGGCPITETSNWYCDSEFPLTLALPAGSWSNATWSNGQTGNSITVNAAGTYACNVIDDNNTTTTNDDCMEIFIFNVFEHPTAQITITEDNIDCPGNSTGDICINSDIGISSVTGTGPNNISYNHSWSSSVQNFCLSESILVGALLSAGTYAMTLTDENGCEQALTYDLQEPDPILITTVSIPDANNNCIDGEIQMTVSGGTGILTYDLLYQNGPYISGTITSTWPSWTNLCAGQYDFYIIDASLCQEHHMVDVDGPLNKRGFETQMSNLTTSDMTLSPNPSNGSFIVQCNQQLSGVEIIDIQGRLIKNIGAIEPNIEQQVILDVPAGLYQIHFQSERGNIVKQIVIQ